VSEQYSSWHITSKYKGSCTLAKFLGKNISDGDGDGLDHALALATLGGATQGGSFQFVSNCPRWQSQVQSHVTVAGVMELHFAKGSTD
jgi:hypothetical protein